MVRKTRLPESEVTRSNPVTGSSEKVFEINEKYIPLHQTGRFSQHYGASIAERVFQSFPLFLWNLPSLKNKIVFPFS